MRHCSILQFGSGASSQAVAPGITRPLHATVQEDTFSTLSVHAKLKVKVEQ